MLQIILLIVKWVWHWIISSIAIITHTFNLPASMCWSGCWYRMNYLACVLGWLSSSLNWTRSTAATANTCIRKQKDNKPKLECMPPRQKEARGWREIEGIRPHLESAYCTTVTIKGNLFKATHGLKGLFIRRGDEEFKINKTSMYENLWLCHISHINWKATKG